MTKQNSKRIFPLREIAILEIAVFLGGALLFDQIIFEGDRFLQVEPHPFWFLIILISVQYGSRAGVLSAFACSAGFLIGNIPERLMEQDLHEWVLSFMKLPFLWFVSAVLIGEVSARRITERELMRVEIKELNKRETALIDTLNNLNKLKRRLEVLVAGQWRTVHKTLKSARDIETMAPDLVLQNSLALVESLLGPEQFSIYIFKENALSYAYGQGWEEDWGYFREFRPESSIFSVVVGERRTLCIASREDELKLGKQGVLAGPIFIPETDELIGMLKIEKMAFTQLSMGSLKNFEFMCEWIGSLYAKALEYQNNTNDTDIKNRS